MLGNVKKFETIRKTRLCQKCVHEKNNNFGNASLHRAKTIFLISHCVEK